MTEVVAMSRSSRQPGARDLFSCSLSDWRLLQQLAISAGWRPLGTTYFSRDEKIATFALHDYEPGDSADLKCVDRDDAIAWATALQNAKERPELLTRVESAANEGPQASNHGEALSTLIAEFSQYAYGGAFGFARLRADDDILPPV